MMLMQPSTHNPGTSRTSYGVNGNVDYEYSGMNNSSHLGFSNLNSFDDDCVNLSHDKNLKKSTCTDGTGDHNFKFEDDCDPKWESVFLSRNSIDKRNNGYHFGLEASKQNSFNNDLSSNTLPYEEVKEFLLELQEEYSSVDSNHNEWLWLNHFAESDNFQRSYTLQDTVANRITRNSPSMLLERHNWPVELGTERLLLREVNQLITFSNQRDPSYDKKKAVELLMSPPFRYLLEAASQILLMQKKHFSSYKISGPVKPVSARVTFESPSYNHKEAAIIKSTASKEQRSDAVSHSYKHNITADEELIESSVSGCYATLKKSSSGQMIKTVVLQKEDEPLGATVRNEGPLVIVGRIIIGGMAHKTGLLREGDQILSVNNVEMNGKDVNTVSEILNKMKGSLTFVVIPEEQSKADTAKAPLELTDVVDLETVRRTAKYHLKALFDYNPSDDMYIPCRDIGLSFNQGDILHVINMRDPNWWQVYRDSEETPGLRISDSNQYSSVGLAGLIPSPELQRQRETMLQLMEARQKRLDQQTDDSAGTNLHSLNMPHEDSSERSPAKNSGFCGPTKSHKRKRKLFSKKRSKNSYSPTSLEADPPLKAIMTYTLVELYTPNARRPRPVVLAGPLFAGRHELLLRIIQTDMNRFAPVVPHTSRSPSENEENGKEFYFVSRNDFEGLLNANQFVEYGLYDKHLYGTSKQAIENVIEQNRICVLSLQAESVSAIRATKFIPYIIFVAPPDDLDTLRAVTSQLNISSAGGTDAELRQTISRSNELCEKFGHLFDKIFINRNTEDTLIQILEEIYRLQTQQQWVPRELLHNVRNSANNCLV